MAKEEDLTADEICTFCKKESLPISIGFSQKQTIYSYYLKINIYIKANV